MEAAAKQLKEARIASGLNQSEFAEKLGVKQSFLSAMERGKRKVSMKVANQLIAQFHVDATTLFSSVSNSAESNKVPHSRTHARTHKAEKTTLLTEEALKNAPNETILEDAIRQNNLLKADSIRNTVEADAVGGEAAQRWGARRITEGKLYKRYPQAESATLSDYMLYGGLGKYIDTMLVELRRTVQSQVDAVLDQSIDGEITMPQAAEKIQEITKPLNSLQGAIEGFENSMFGLVAATVEQYPSLLTLVKGTPLYFSLEEWLENSADNEISVEA